MDTEQVLFEFWKDALQHILQREQKPTAGNPCISYYGMKVSAFEGTANSYSSQHLCFKESFFCLRAYAEGDINHKFSRKNSEELCDLYKEVSNKQKEFELKEALLTLEKMKEKFKAPASSDQL